MEEESQNIQANNNLNWFTNKQYLIDIYILK